MCVVGLLEILSYDVGLVILGLLCEFDEVVYLWFVLVYWLFFFVDDFVCEIEVFCVYCNLLVYS